MYIEQGYERERGEGKDIRFFEFFSSTKQKKKKKKKKKKKS
jgi:hypothetical protein